MSLLPAPDSNGNADQLMARLRPVWINTYWVQNALELCEGIWKHGDELSEQHHGHFFGLVHNFALTSAVLGICKLFDLSNPRYDKDTIPDLFDYVKTTFTDTYASRLDKGTLIDLGVCDVAATRIVTCFNRASDFTQTKDDLMRIVEHLMPTCDNSPTLKQLFLVRDKFIAHQERVCFSSREQCDHLPSLDEMEKLNNWACTFCQFTGCIMTNETFLPHTVSARMAALNVVAKILGKNFEVSGDDYQGQEAFFSR